MKKIYLHNRYITVASRINTTISCAWKRLTYTTSRSPWHLGQKGKYTAMSCALTFGHELLLCWVKVGCSRNEKCGVKVQSVSVKKMIALYLVCHKTHRTGGFTKIKSRWHSWASFLVSFSSQNIGMKKCLSLPRSKIYVSKLDISTRKPFSYSISSTVVLVVPWRPNTRNRKVIRRWAPYSEGQMTGTHNTMETGEENSL